jgi:hypothetical protein
MAVPVIAMLAIEGLKVELVDDVEDEPGQVAFGQPVAQVGRQEEGLVAVTAPESCRPWRILYFYQFAQMRPLFKGQVAQGVLPMPDVPARTYLRTALARLEPALGWSPPGPRAVPRVRHREHVGLAARRRPRDRVVLEDPRRHQLLAEVERGLERLPTSRR